MTRELPPGFRCPACIKQGWPDYFGSAPTCGWKEDGTFNPDNWNCETLVRLRMRAREMGTVVWMNDHNLYVVPLERTHFDDDGWAVLTSYKEHGATESARFVQNNQGLIHDLRLDDIAPEHLKLQEDMDEETDR